MSKGERKRTMVYSNVNKKKADAKSASKKSEKIDLDEEIFIGLAKFAEPETSEKAKKIKKGQAFSKNDKNEKKKIDKKKDKKNEKEDAENQPNPIIKSQAQKSKNLTVQERIKKQKRRVIRILSTIILLTVLLIGGIIYFFLSPIFNIKAIEVINNNNIPAEQIISSSGIQKDVNTFKFSAKQARKIILENPYVEDVKISRNLFANKVIIDVKERTATLMLEYGNSYVYINNQGYILEISTIKIDSPILKGYQTPLEDVKPGNRLNKDDLERLETVLKIIEAANSKGIGDLITHINIKNKKNYIMTLESEDKTVYLGDCSDLSTQMLYVKEMLQREKNIEGDFFVDMDLNTSNPVFREKV